MKSVRSLKAMTPQEKNEYLLNAQEMNSFYTLPLDERQAVLDRISNSDSREKGTAGT